MDLETENRIAAILMKEAAELRRQAERDGVDAYLKPPNVRGRPNSRFLTATVLGVQQEGSSSSKRTRLEDILKQTLDWDRRCLVATGRSGRVYRPASYHDYKEVAFKRVFQEPINREFRSERFFLRDQRHENIVGLRGDCTENNEKILILEYIPNGTLFDRLQGTKTKVLDWETRMNVALGAARAINHIHRAIPWAIIHRDIKSTHILLDEMDNAKIIDPLLFKN